MNIFISYSREDQNIAKKLYSDIQSAGMTPWLDLNDLLPGQNWKAVIKEKIIESEFFIALLSLNSLSKKGFVHKEIKIALDLLDERPTPSSIFLIPVRINDCKPLDEKLQDLHWVDIFPSYENGLSKILHVLSSDFNDNSTLLKPETTRKELSFIDKIAELYRLFHYEVEFNTIVCDHKVDLFLTGHLGDLTIYRIISCYLTEVGLNDLVVFQNKIDSIRQKYPSVIGTIVSGVSFSDIVSSNANKYHNIQLITFMELSSQLVDGFTYAQKLIKECESNSLYQIDCYIENFVRYEPDSKDYPAFNAIEEWLHDEVWNQLTILGDLGTGKTFLTRILSYRLAKKFLESPLDNPLPIRIDLRNADREFSIEGLVLTHMSRNGLAKVTFDAFQYSLYEGNIILILDGFDEMSSRVSPIVTKRNFNELMKCVKKRAKVLLTCRTHYFKSRSEEEEMLIGGNKEYESESVRDLYWELTSRKGYKIIYLRSFNVSQIEEYIHKKLGKSSEEALKKIRNTYNLMELSQRPLLLDMVIKSIDKIKSNKINIVSLYEVFTDAWIHREQWRELLTPKIKLDFLKSLSFSLWQENLQNIHYTKLIEYLKNELSELIFNPQDLLELDHEVRIATFLNRDELGYYGFAHKSFGEYFLARYLSIGFNNRNVDCLKIKQLTPEIVLFLYEMVDFHSIKIYLTEILQNEYKYQISENALICLYYFLRHKTVYENKEIKISLPVKMNLNGSHLSQIVLENAIMKEANLSKADLSEAILNGVNLDGSNLIKTKLSKADLQFSIICNSNLSSADLLESNLESTDFSNSILDNADFSKSNLIRTVLKNTTLNNTKFDGVFLNQEDHERLKIEIGTELYHALFGRVDKYDIINQKWELIENNLSFIEKVSYAACRRTGVEKEDISSYVKLQILERNIYDRLKDETQYKIRNYIQAIALSIARDFEIREKRYSDFLDDDLIILEELPDNIDDPEMLTIKADLKTKLFEVMEKSLSKDNVLILKAHYIEEKSLSEISDEFDIPVNRLHRRIRKAIEILKNEISKIDDR